jgi:hypothetical protein
MKGRHDRNVIRIAEAFQPVQRGVDLDIEPDIDQVAGHRQMIVIDGAEVVDQRAQGLWPARRTSAAAPVDVAEDAFRGELAPSYVNQRSEMGIGKLGQSEGTGGAVSWPGGL